MMVRMDDENEPEIGFYAVLCTIVGFTLIMIVLGLIQ